MPDTIEHILWGQEHMTSAKLLGFLNPSSRHIQKLANFVSWVCFFAPPLPSLDVICSCPLFHKSLCFNWYFLHDPSRRGWSHVVVIVISRFAARMRNASNVGNSTQKLNRTRTPPLSSSEVTIDQWIADICGTLGRKLILWLPRDQTTHHKSHFDTLSAVVKLYDGKSH